MKRNEITLSNFIDTLQAKGRYSVELSELENAIPQSSQHLQTSLQRLKKKKRIFSPHRGFYVIVPLEFQSVGAPPLTWYIDDMMDSMHLIYYVSLLSAAAMHGSSHQQPMVFQIMANHPTRSCKTPREKIEFHFNKELLSLPTQEVQTQTGTMKVSSPEVTAFDLIKYEKHVGGMSAVALAMSGMKEKFRARKLANLCEHYPAAVCQRLGVMLDFLQLDHLSETLFREIRGSVKKQVLFALSEAKGGRLNSKWNVMMNETLEIDE